MLSLLRRAAGVAGLFLLAGTAAADIIVLKSGRKISATNVIEEGDRIYYETSAGRLSIRKALVVRVERGGGLSGGGGYSSGGGSELPVTAPRVDLGEGFDEVRAQAVQNGSINREYLAKLEGEAQGGDEAAGRRVALGHHAAALHLIRKGEVEEAIGHYRRGLTYAPQHLGLLLSISYLHLKQSQYSQALEYVERAKRATPDDPDVFKLAGWAYYGANKMEDAVREWKRSYELRPDSEVEAALEKARRDQEEESQYREGVTRHFNLRYHGGAAPQLAREILRALEEHFRAIESQINYSPPESIGVILYTEQAFQDITSAPAWAGALNDGRIRVPVQGLAALNSELSRVLKHELVHSFIGQKTRNRCPTWINEGIAQWLESKRSGEMAETFVHAYEQYKRVLPLAEMEGTWTGLSPDAAAAYYAWSLAVVEYIVGRYGMGDVERVLERINTEPSGEGAVQGILRMDYSELGVETVKFLKQTYLR